MRPTSMLLGVLGCLTVLVVSASIGIAQDAVSDDALLAALDEARFLDDDVNRIEVRIVSETPDETREASIRLRFAEFEAGGFSRIEFLSPEELAGQVYLNTPDAAYFFGPDLDFPIKTSASTEVFGDAAVAQTSGIRFLGSYTIDARREVVGEDGVGRLEVDLAAIDFSVAFQAITVVVDPETLRPLTMRLFALSGLPFYDVFFEAYETRDETGDVYARTQRIVNLLLVGRTTTSEILAIGAEELPASLFDPGALGATD